MIILISLPFPVSVSMIAALYWFVIISLKKFCIFSILSILVVFAGEYVLFLFAYPLILELRSFLSLRVGYFLLADVVEDVDVVEDGDVVEATHVPVPA